MYGPNDEHVWPTFDRWDAIDNDTLDAEAEDERYDGVDDDLLYDPDDARDLAIENERWDGVS